MNDGTRTTISKGDYLKSDADKGYHVLAES